MQYTLTISQTKTLEWGLNAQQALLFAFVYECPSWAKPIRNAEGIFYALSKAKIVEELPLLTSKPDTAYRLLKQLELAGVINLSHTPGITLVRLTDKGREWNRTISGSEKYPSNKSDGRKNIRGTSEKYPIEVGKISELVSEKSPTNQDTSNQDTNQDTSHSLPAAASDSGEVVVVDGADEKAAKPKTEKQQANSDTWSAYASQYAIRYGVEPVRNAKSNAQAAQLVSRLGTDEAPQVAAYFVTINDQYLLRNMHDFGMLISKAEAIRTQWATGRQMNGRTARQMEDTQANINAAQEAGRMITQGGERNAFL